MLEESLFIPDFLTITATDTNGAISWIGHGPSLVFTNQEILSITDFTGIKSEGVATSEGYGISTSSKGPRVWAFSPRTYMGATEDKIRRLEEAAGLGYHLTAVINFIGLWDAGIDTMLSSPNYNRLPCVAVFDSESFKVAARGHGNERNISRSFELWERKPETVQGPPVPTRGNGGLVIINAVIKNL